MKFQSTHPHGVRRAAVARIYRPGCVSIHAPARGATDSGVDANSKDRVSIHAPSRGATLAKLRQMLRVSMFQSTHPHGVRHRARIVWFIPFFVSIHAPSRGATRLIRSSNRDRMAFQSTHPHGVRRTKRIPIKNISLFQSTHPHGVRRCHQSRR